MRNPKPLGHKLMLEGLLGSVSSSEIMGLMTT